MRSASTLSVTAQSQELLHSLSPREIRFATLAGFLILISFCWSQLFSISEYQVFYAGERLVGTPSLYDKASNQREQIKAVGAYGGDELIYEHPPFEAALLYPLGKLPYRASVLAFQALSAIALFGFVYLWPYNRPSITLLACAWSIPLLLSFMFVEDDMFLLLPLAVVFRIYKEKAFAAGLLMSLLGIKFHLFLLLPLLLLGQRRWKMASGFAAGCGLLVAISFLVAGWRWPEEMANIIRSGTIPREYLMPNFRGILQAFTRALLPELALDLVVASIAFWLLRRSTFEEGMALMLLGSLLVSHHAGTYDCVLLIPVLLLVARHKLRSHGQWLVLLLLSPVPYYLLVSGGVLSLVAIFTIICLFVLLASQVYLHSYQGTKLTHAQLGMHAGTSDCPVQPAT